MKQSTLWLLTLLSASIGVIIYLMFFHYKVVDDSGKQAEYSLLQKEYSKLYTERSLVKDTIERLNDSIFRLNTRLGITEIELNQKESRIREVSTAYQSAKIRRDTVSMVTNCDSIIGELNTDYIAQNIYFRTQVDSIDNLYRKTYAEYIKLDSSTSVIADSLAVVLIRCRSDKAILSDQIARKKKLPFLAAVGGFILGVLTTFAK